MESKISSSSVATGISDYFQHLFFRKLYDLSDVFARAVGKHISPKIPDLFEHSHLPLKKTSQVAAF